MFYITIQKGYLIITLLKQDHIKTHNDLKMLQSIFIIDNILEFLESIW